MKKAIFCKTLVAMAVVLPSMAYASQNIVLDGQHLTVDQVVSASEGDVNISIAKNAMAKIKDSSELVIEAARQGVPVYGLTVGVGKSKDVKIFGNDGKLSPDLIDLSKTFNSNMLMTHSGSTGDLISPEVIRASMVIRLNQIATGHVGVHPDVVRMYEDFINNDIVPVVPQDGSIGVADICLASNIGSAMIGKRDVFYKGKRMASLKAMKLAHVKPLSPFGKDSLSILSNNSISVAKVLLELEHSKKIIDFTTTLFPFSLEAVNGNISPFLPHSMAARPMPYAGKVSSEILDNLKGSYLFDKDSKRALQDPLSYRQGQWAISNAYTQFYALEKLIKIHINSSDDNPVISVGATPGKYASSGQVGQYFVKGKKVSGAINSVSNFDVTPIASTLEGYLLAYAQLGKFSSFRSLKLFDSYFTNLPRGLVAPENKNGQGFYALPDAHVSLVAKLAHTVMPTSFFGTATQSGIEDTYTNLYLLSSNLEESNDIIERIYSYELMQAAQAVDIRVKHYNKHISVSGNKLLSAYRKHVTYFNKDRLIGPDLQKTINFIESKTSINK